jgi:di/tripeptidase
MKTYLDFFKEISAIPRKSGKEDKIADLRINRIFIS